MKTRWLCGLILAAVGGMTQAQDLDFCVDSVAELEDAVMVATIANPTVSRVLVRVEQGTYNLSGSSVMRSEAQSSLMLRESLSILGGYSNGCASRAINASNTVLQNTGPARLKWNHTRDLTIQSVHFESFDNAIEFSNLNLNDTVQRVELSNNRFTAGFGGVTLEAQAGNGTSMILFKNNQFFGRAPEGACVVRFRGDTDTDASVRLIASNNTLAGNGSTGDGLCLSHIDSPEFYNNVLRSNPGDDLVGLGNNGQVIARHNTRDSVSGLTFVVNQDNNASDPLFVDYPAGDLRLQTTSPAANSGYPTVPYGTGSVDVAGQTRAQGLVIDRGANESSNAGIFVLTVTTPADSGAGSLREAITQANATPGLNGIIFNIPGATCPKIITVSTALPQITESLIINAATQPGSAPNTMDLGYNGDRCVLLKGNSGLFGLHVPGSAPIGTTLTLDSMAFGNFAYGIFLQGGSAHRIVGSQFGTALGVTSNAGGGGIFVSGANDVQIGGSDPSERNIFALQNLGGSFVDAGVLIGESSLRTEVINNYFGTQPNGVTAADNSYGIVTDGDDGTFSDNVISNSTEIAIWLRSNARNNLVNLSRIGLPAFCIGSCGSTSGNAQGMLIEGQANRTGYNEFGHNTAGIRITGNDNAVWSTLVYGGPLGAPPIDVGDAGLSLNDNDGVANPPGGNRGINFPLLSSVNESVNPGFVRVNGVFQSINGSYKIHIYGSARRISAGLGPRCEGNKELGAVNVSISNAPGGENGSAEFELDIATADIDGQWLTAQAVRKVTIDGVSVFGDSSEYGGCREAPLFGNGFE